MLDSTNYCCIAKLEKNVGKRENIVSFTLIYSNPKPEVCSTISNLNLANLSRYNQLLSMLEFIRVQFFFLKSSQIPPTGFGINDSLSNTSGSLVLLLTVTEYCEKMLARQTFFSTIANLIAVTKRSLNYKWHNTTRLHLSTLIFHPM